MIVSQEPSGFQVTQDKRLLIRIDMRPEPGDQTYAKHYVNVPVFPPGGYPGKVDVTGRPIKQADYDSWLAGLPHIWRVNPCLCMFVQVPELFTKDTLKDFLGQLLAPTMVANLDVALVRPDSAHYVSPLLRGKLAMTDQRVKTTDYADLIASTKALLADLTLPLSHGGDTIITPESIDVGPGATDRATVFEGNATSISLDNAANADGTIDTYQCWFNIDATLVKGAIHYLVSGTTFQCRSAAALGSVASGSAQSFPGLSMAVLTGDLLSIRVPTYAHNIEADYGAFIKTKYNYDGAIVDNQADYGSDYNRRISIYATGTETSTFIPKIIFIG